MERSSMNALVPSRSTGISARNHIEQMATWTIGFFKASNAFGDKPKLNTGGSDWVFTGRLTGAPIYEDKGETVFHVGASGSWRNTENGLIATGYGPDVVTQNPFVVTQTFNNKVAGLLGLETAVVVGPFSAQAEYTVAQFRPTNFGTFTAPGWYIQASWFLTGEHRPYDPKNGYFKRVKVKKRLGDDGGFGAVQLAVRVDQLKLNRGSPAPGMSISGYYDSATTNDLGNIINYTIGANWHLNDNSRIMANWVITRPQGSEVWQFLGVRFQVDF
jgi:phosphate-selective porin OprO/OprP